MGEGRSAQAEQLVGLQAETPLRVREAVIHRELRVLLQVGTIHGLQREMPKSEVLEPFRLRFPLRLRVYELELVPVEQLQRRCGLGAHANPVDSGRRIPGPVRLDGDLEAGRVKCLDQGSIELQ